MNVLLNINNFSNDFAFAYLKDIIKPHHRVLIFPFAYHEDYIHNAEEYAQHFSKGCQEIEEIIAEFSEYGVSRKNIKIVNYYTDSRQQIKSKIYHSDILFFTGGYPDRILYRLDDRNIRNYILKFPGIVMGTSAGAMIQFDKYHVTPEDDTQTYDFQFGLGLISGFDIEVHFEENETHLKSIEQALIDNDVPVYALPNDSGLIVDDGEITIMGDVTIYRNP